MLQLQYKQESQGGNLEAGDNPSPSRGGAGEDDRLHNIHNEWQ